MYYNKKRKKKKNGHTKPPFQEKNTKFSNEFRAIFTAKVLELVQRICPKLEV